jgi:hypothetical protein
MPTLGVLRYRACGPDLPHHSIGALRICPTTTKSSTKRVGGPAKLNARMLRTISLMVEGHPDDPSRTPYGLYDAAAAVGYRRRAARELAKSEVVVAAYSDAIKAANGNHLCPTPARRSRRFARKKRGASSALSRLQSDRKLLLEAEGGALLSLIAASLLT